MKTLSSLKQFIGKLRRLKNMKVSDINFISLDIWVRYGLIVFAVLFGGLQHFYPQIMLLNAVFIMSTAGIVGYFTNYIAIKMLFQPQHGQVLGWRGLVPKNKHQVAISLGESIQTQLLSPDIILEYVNQNDLLTKGIDGLTDWIDTNLRNPTVRKAITECAVENLKTKGPDLLMKGFDISEQSLKHLADNPGLMEQIWQLVRESLMDYLNSTENRKQVAESLHRLLLKGLPELAQALNNALEEYLSRKHTMGSVGLSVKKIASFDGEAIEKLLVRFVNDPDTLEQAMGMLDVLIEHLEQNLESEQTKQAILNNVETKITWSADKVRDKLLPEITTRFEQFLDDKNNWQHIDHYCISTMTWAKNRLVHYAQSEEGQHYLKEQISHLIHKLNVTNLVEEQVMKLDTDELENMILDNTGGNLVVIQVLGGAMGIVAGLVQVHIGFALPVAGLVGIVWIEAYRNRKRHG